VVNKLNNLEANVFEPFRNWIIAGLLYNATDSQPDS
jgi:hypothetical protein